MITKEVVETLDGGQVVVATMIAMVVAARATVVVEEAMVVATLRVATRARTVVASAVAIVAAPPSSQPEAMVTPASQVVVVLATPIGEIAAANKMLQVAWAEAAEVVTLQALLNKIATTPTQAVVATTPQWAEEEEVNRAISQLQQLLPSLQPLPQVVATRFSSPTWTGIRPRMICASFFLPTESVRSRS